MKMCKFCYLQQRFSRVFKHNLLHALEWLRDAWNDVSDATIKNCFRSAGFAMEGVVSV